MTSRDNDIGTSRQCRVLVVELGDVVPRRRSDRPNLFVGITTQSRAVRYEQLKRGKGPKWVKGHIVQLRPDLYKNYRPGDRRVAARQKTRLVNRLKRRGYTVNRDERVWQLYVVQLDESESEDPGKGWVYVGETSRDPEMRLKQHLEGARNKRIRLYSPVVNDHGLALRRDLMKGLPTLYTARDAKKAEGELADRLRELGYSVAGGH